MSKSSIVSGMGLAMGIITNLVKEVQKRGGTDDDIHRLSTPEGEDLLGKIADLIINRLAFRVIVDYSRSFAEMIKAGKCNWVNSDITEDNFPIEGGEKQSITVTLFHFKRTVNSDDVITKMDKQGYRPCRIEELLALGEKHPDLQRQFPIVALGSVWQSPGGRRRVPGLYESASERLLSLSWFGYGWDPYYRFVGFRK